MRHAAMARGQVEIVERPKMILICNRICAICVNRKQNVPISPADFSDDIDVPARFDLQFDSLITQRQIFVHAFQESIQIGLNAEANAHGNPFPLSSDQLR